MSDDTLQETPQQRQNRLLRARGGEIVCARLEPEIYSKFETYRVESGMQTRQAALLDILEKFFKKT